MNSERDKNIFASILRDADPYQWLLAALAIFGLYAMYVLVDMPAVAGDTETYVNALRFWQGEPVTGNIYISRILTTPLLLAGAYVLDHAMDNRILSILAVNWVFYLSFPAVSYAFFKIALDDRRQAFIASVLTVSNYYFLRYGPVALADIGGWFFFIWSSYFGLRHYRTREAKYYYLAMLVSSVGLLFKEYGALGAVNAGSLLLFSAFGAKEKIKRLAIGAVLFAILPLSYHVAIDQIYGYNYFNWYSYASNAYVADGQPGSLYNLTELVKVMGWLFFAGWPAFAPSFVYAALRREKKFIMTAIPLLPAALSFLAWPVMTQRLAFVLVPWLAMVTAYGLGRIKSGWIVITYLLFYILVNYNIGYLINIINL